MMEWTSEKYKNNLMDYEKRDGIKAIIIYCLIMGCKCYYGNALKFRYQNVGI